MKKTFLLAFLTVLIVSACSGSAGDGAAETVEQYIQALADKNKPVITNLSCPEWEESAILEVDGLLSVDAAVKDLVCETSGKEGDSTIVTCTGSLDLTYNDEIRAIDLSLRSYYLQENNGTWQVCEYR